MIWAHFDWLLG